MPTVAAAVHNHPCQVVAAVGYLAEEVVELVYPVVVGEHFQQIVEGNC